MARLGLSAGLALLALWTWPALAAGHPSEATPDADGALADRQAARRGFDLLMNGDPDAAIIIFHQIQQIDPQSPLGYLLEAEALWWNIYYSTAHLLDPDVFDVATVEVSPLDFHFADLIHVATTRAEIRIRSKQDVARNTLYEGMAYALTARLDGLREETSAPAGPARKCAPFCSRPCRWTPTLLTRIWGWESTITMSTLYQFAQSVPGAGPPSGG